MEALVLTMACQGQACVKKEIDDWKLWADPSSAERAGPD